MLKNGLTRYLSWGVGAQAFSSATTLTISFAVVFFSSKSDFGWFSLVLATAMFIAGVGNALIVTQMVVLLPCKDQERREFLTSTVLAVAVFSFVTVLTGAGLKILSKSLEISATNVFAIGWSAAVLGAALLFRDLLVRYCYNLRNSMPSLIVNFAIFIAILFYSFFGGSSSSFAQDIAIIWSVLLATLSVSIFFLLYREHLGEFSFRVFKRSGLEMWIGGRFAVLSHLVIFFRAQAYVFLLAVLFSVEAVGEVNAVRLFVAPLLIFTPTLAQLLTPVIAQTLVSDLEEANQILRSWNRRVIIFVFGYFLMISPIYGFSEELLAERGYEINWFLLVCWVIVAGLIAIRSLQEVLIISTHRFDVQLGSNFFGLAILVVGIILFSFLGDKLAIILALAVSELAVGIVLWQSNRVFIEKNGAGRGGKPL